MTDMPNPTAADPVVEAAADAPAGAQPADDVVARLQKERDEDYDRLLRKTAEFDNYRKRIERERRDADDAAAASSIEDLLPIVDDLERALKADAGSDAAEAYPRRRRADSPAAAGPAAQARRQADRGARRGLRSARPPGGRARADGGPSRRRGDRRVPPRIHARRSAAAAGDGEGGQSVSRARLLRGPRRRAHGHRRRRSRAPIASWR